jgi:GcrA cell cycle regulator
MSWGWPEEDDERLAALWEEGVSGRLIGVALKRSRGAVLGRARRLGLSPRPVPVAFMQDVERIPKQVPHVVVQKVLLPVPAPPGPPKRKLSLWLVPTGVVRECQWPHGTPGQASFYLCGDPSFPCRPYCERHCRRAFLGWRAHAVAS